MYEACFSFFKTDLLPYFCEIEVSDRAAGGQICLLAVPLENASMVDVSSNDDNGIILLSASDTSYVYDFTIEDLIESGANVWYLSAGNSMMSGSDTYWLFPDGASLSNINGYLVNTGNSIVTGLYLGTSLSSTPSTNSVYSSIDCVLYPLSGYNSVSAGINGSGDCIVNLYTRSGSTSNYYMSTTSYVNVFSVLEAPALGSDFSSSELAIFGLLAFSVLVSLVGVILRR